MKIGTTSFHHQTYEWYIDTTEQLQLIHHLLVFEYHLGEENLSI